MSVELPRDYEGIVAMWRDGDLPHGRMAVWISRQLGELLNDDPVIEQLKELAREVSDRLESPTAVKGFLVDGASTYTQRYADLKGLEQIRDTLEGMNPQAWELIEQYVIKTRVVSRRASVRFVASDKAKKREAERQRRIHQGLEETS